MELTVSRSLVAALVLALQALLVLGSGYELRVMVHAYRNPTGTCHDCFFSETQTEPGCCDRHSETVNCDANPGDRCDNFIIFCQRALGTPADNITCPPFPVGQEQVSSHMDNSDDVMFADEVFGLDNPMLFIGSSWQGTQVFVEVMDHDAGSSSFDLVDVFAVDVVIPLGPSFTDIQTYNGLYGIGQLDLSFQVNCSENSFGPNCTVECIPVDNNTGHFNCDSEGNQVCIAGYTGTNCLEDVDECANSPCVNRVCNNLRDSFSCGDCLPGFQLNGSDCSINIDDCVGIDCGTNRQCIDGINNHSCECAPGFVGDDCITENCIGIDCRNGVCQNSNESFTCECNAGYTGQSCSVDINECEENSCSGNRQCVDGIATFTCKCNPDFSGENCTTAEPTIEASTNLATIIGAAVGGFVGLLLLLALLVLVVALLVRRRRQRSVKFKPAKGNCYEDTLTRSGNTATVNSSGFVGEQHGTAAVILNRNNSEAERELRNPIYGMSIENSYDEIGGATGGAIAAERLTTAGTEPVVERELENPIYGMGDEDDVDDEMVDNNTYGKSDKLAPPTSAKTAPSENEYDAIEGLTYSRVENGKTLDYKDM